MGAVVEPKWGEVGSTPACKASRTHTECTGGLGGGRRHRLAPAGRSAAPRRAAPRAPPWRAPRRCGGAAATAAGGAAGRRTFSTSRERPRAPFGGASPDERQAAAAGGTVCETLPGAVQGHRARLLLRHIGPSRQPPSTMNGAVVVAAPREGARLRGTRPSRSLGGSSASLVGTDGTLGKCFELGTGAGVGRSIRLSALHPSRAPNPFRHDGLADALGLPL